MSIPSKLMACVPSNADKGGRHEILFSAGSYSPGPITQDLYGNPVSTTAMASTEGIVSNGAWVSIDNKDKYVGTGDWLVEIWATGAIPDIDIGPTPYLSIRDGIATFPYVTHEDVALQSPKMIPPESGAFYLGMGVQNGRWRLWLNGKVIFYAISTWLPAAIDVIKFSQQHGTVTDFRLCYKNVYGILGQVNIWPMPSPLTSMD